MHRAPVGTVVLYSLPRFLSILYSGNSMNNRAYSGLIPTDNAMNYARLVGRRFGLEPY